MRMNVTKKCLGVLFTAMLSFCAMDVFADEAPINFGDAQSSTLVGKAWQALARKDFKAVLAYTNKTISLYGGQAAKMQDYLSDYTCGFSETSKYGPLNDVATSYYIQGQAYQAANMNDKAKAAYDKLIRNYSLGQTFDPQSGFWKPTEAAEEKLDMMTVGLDYGDQTSSRLVQKAWLAFEADDLTAVEAFVNKILELYADKAKKMQASMRGYAAGSNDQIFAYWAVNDVGTALFILGETYQRNGKKQEAVEAYNRVINELSYAQTWDPCGWFWKPAAAAKEQLAMIESGTHWAFGDHSSAFLVQQAWAALKANDVKAVQVYVNKTVELYGKQAKKMQASMRDYVSGSNDKIFRYYALNDVGTALLILGEVYQNTGKKKEAAKVYKKVIDEFPYAQCWYDKGWFWKPAEAAQMKLQELH